MRELPNGRLCSICEKQFHFSVAEKALDLMKGLSEVADMGEYDGMLFDFGCDFSPIMTPKGLKFPVDLAFITRDGKIVEIHRLDPEEGFNRGTVRDDIWYALEVPVGFFDLHGITLGSCIQLD